MKSLRFALVLSILSGIVLSCQLSSPGGGTSKTGTLVVNLPTSNSKSLLRADAIAATVAYGVYVYLTTSPDAPVTPAVNPVPAGTSAVTLTGLNTGSGFAVEVVALGQSQLNGGKDYYVTGAGSAVNVTILPGAAQQVNVPLYPVDFSFELADNGRLGTPDQYGFAPLTLQLPPTLASLSSFPAGISSWPAAAQYGLQFSSIGWNLQSQRIVAQTGETTGPYASTINTAVGTSSTATLYINTYMTVLPSYELVAWGENVAIEYIWPPGSPYSNYVYNIPGVHWLGFYNCPGAYDAQFVRTLVSTGGLGINVYWN